MCKYLQHAIISLKIRTLLLTQGASVFLFYKFQKWQCKFSMHSGLDIKLCLSSGLAP